MQQLLFQVLTEFAIDKNLLKWKFCPFGRVTHLCFIIIITQNNLPYKWWIHLMTPLEDYLTINFIDICDLVIVLNVICTKLLCGWQLNFHFPKLFQMYLIPLWLWFIFTNHIKIIYHLNFWIIYAWNYISLIIIFNCFHQIWWYWTLYFI